MSDLLLIVVLFVGFLISAFGVAEYLAMRSRVRPGLPWAEADSASPSLIERFRNDRH